MRFAVVAEHPVFADVARAVTFAFVDFGHVARLSSDRSTSAGEKLVLFAGASPVPVPKDSIVFNAEQLVGRDDAFLERNFGQHRDAGTVVWDYSAANVEVLRCLGVRAVHCPVGYHLSMECP